MARDTMMVEERKPVRAHSLSLEDREKLSLRGVVEVDSFQESEVVLLTEGGYLSIEGEDLHILKLDLEAGQMFIEGLINAMTYAQEQQRREGGLFSRMFR